MYHVSVCSFIPVTVTQGHVALFTLASLRRVSLVTPLKPSQLWCPLRHSRRTFDTFASYPTLLWCWASLFNRQVPLNFRRTIGILLCSCPRFVQINSNNSFRPVGDNSPAETAWKIY